MVKRRYTSRATHHGRRDVGLAVEDGAGLAQQRRHDRVLLHRLVAPGYKADGRVEPLDLEVILQ
jgi:hypothetical protein